MKAIFSAAILAIAGLIIFPSAILAANHSEFVGEWHAIDYGDGSLMRLTIAGPRDGPFNVVWTESFFTFCDGPAGVARGSATLDPTDPTFLTADLLLRCGPTGDTVEFQPEFRYLPDFDVLSNLDSNGVVTTWSRMGQPLVPPVASPFMVGSVVGNFIWVVDFLEGATLELTVYNTVDRNEERWQAIVEDYDGEIVNFHPGDDGVELMDGNLIVVSDGQVEDSLVLELITMEVFDLDTDYMAGTAPRNRFVRVVAGFGPDGSEQRIIETASNGVGAWTADFEGIADLEEDWRPWSFAHIFDADGDANEAIAPIPPRFTVFPEGEGLDGYDWPDGEVTASVAGKPDCEFTQTSSDGFFNMGFPGGCDVEIGDEVTLTDGSTTRMHTVQNLTVTGVDGGTNTVSGASDASGEIHLWVHDFFGESEMQATADTDGNWEANFFDARGFDLVEGMGGRSEILDPAGNSTAVDWHVSGP